MQIIDNDMASHLPRTSDKEEEAKKKRCREINKGVKRDKYVNKEMQRCATHVKDILQEEIGQGKEN